MAESGCPIHGEELDIFFRRIVDKKKVCVLSKCEDGILIKKELFRCRNTKYDAGTRRLTIVRLDTDKRIGLQGWTATFDEKGDTLSLSKGLWTLSCKLDPADVKWIRMRLR